MGAYTWTFIRIDKLTNEQIIKCVKKYKNCSETSSYHNYIQMKWKDALNDWLKFHKEEHDFFTGVYKVPEKELTEEHLTKELKRELKRHKLKLKCYNMVLNGEMSIEEMLRKTHQLRHGDAYIIYRQKHYYINIQKEIFRLYDYSTKEFHTTEELIKHCKKIKGDLFLDYTSNNIEYQKFTPELENKIREYYNKIGDNNFYVHFG